MLNSQILNFTAPPNNPNQVNIGRIFMEFKSLQEIYITQSNVPAIGDSSFWPGRRVKLLDLSFNNITILRDSDFNGLSGLESLNLSDNSLEGIPYLIEFGLNINFLFPIKIRVSFSAVSFVVKPDSTQFSAK